MGRPFKKNEQTVNQSNYHRLTADPANSEYPEELLPRSWIGSWVTIFKDPVDLKKQTDNEVHILTAPDYAEI